jgi:DNA polymerase III delta prime subunit
MPGWNLPENQDVEDRLRLAADRGTLAHALLFTGAGDREAAALYAAAALECTAPSGRPCGVCAACRKIRRGIHPDVLRVQDAAHKNVAVDVIRDARSDAWIRPNEGRRKIYFFPDCALLTEQDQNVLLKIVEEGPPYAAFLFCAENPSVVLPTLRSRCVEMKLRPAAGGSAMSENAAALCRAAAERKRAAPTEVCVRLEREKLSRDGLQTLLEETRSAFLEALLAQYGGGKAEKEPAAGLAKNLTNVQIMRTIELLQKYRQECLYNVSPGQVLGALAVELEDIL